MIAVSNASPLIILAKLSLLDLPPQLFNEVIISQEVWDEVVIKGTGLPGSVEIEQAGWIRVIQVLYVWHTKIWIEKNSNHEEHKEHED